MSVSTSEDRPVGLNASAAEIEALADELGPPVGKFQVAIRDGHVPRAFPDHLAQLRRAAEGLIDT